MHKLQKLLIVFIFSVFVYALYSVISSKIVSAQCVTGLITPRAVNGLISTQSQNTFSSKFGNDTNNCVNSNQAVLPTFQLPNYAQLKSLFFDQLKATNGIVKNTLGGSATDANLNSWLQSASTSNYVTGDLTVNSPINAASTGVAVVFIDGNLNINTNINYHPTDSNGGLVFVVQGDANIALGVQNVDAVIISTGTICTAYASGCPPPPAGYTDPYATSALNVNGSLIALNANKPIIFRRKMLNNNNPAEVINQKPKYSVILRYLFSQTLTITTENTNYADNGTSGLSFSCSPPSSAVIGSPATWTSTTPTGANGPGTYSYSWSGTDGLTGAGSTANITYATAGNKTGSLTVTSGSQALTQNCGSVTVATPPPPSVSCTVNSSTSPVTMPANGSVFYNASPTGGAGSGYICSWSGNATISSALGSNCSGYVTYISAATNNASVTATAGGSSPSNASTCPTVTTTAPSGVSMAFSPTTLTHGTSETIFFTKTSPSTTDWIGYFSNTILGTTKSQAILWFYTSSCTTTAGGTAKSSGSCTITIPAGDTNLGRNFQFFNASNTLLYISNTFIVR